MKILYFIISLDKAIDIEPKVIYFVDKALLMEKLNRNYDAIEKLKEYISILYLFILKKLSNCC